MNDLALTRLKILVETAVRPLRIGWPGKVAMREDLLATTVSWYDKHFGEAGDEVAALERTIEQFGNPSDVIARLQVRAPGPYLRIDGLNTCLACRPGESTWRRIGRHVRCLTYVLLTITLVSVGLVALGSWLPGSRAPRRASIDDWLSLLSECIVMFLVLLIHGSAFIVLGHLMWNAFHRRSTRFWPEILALAAGACLVAPSFSLAHTLATEQGQVGAAMTRSLRHVIVAPFVLLFVVDFMWRTLEGPGPGSWPRRLILDLAWVLGAALASFALSFAITHDSWTSLENCYGVVLVGVLWLLPIDLMFSSPEIVRRIRFHFEWESLPLNGRNGHR